MTKSGDMKVASPSQVMSGCLENLPPLETRTVRVFLSSTFTDMTEERNILQLEGEKQVRKFCSEKGLDFQFVDMRWGVRDDRQIDHTTTELCLYEIAQSRKISRGPSFVVLLGNRYGYRPYPATIEELEFNTLWWAATQEARNTALLEEWFQKDSNAVPTAYKLQPITDKFKYYNDDSERHADKRQRDHEGWDAVNNILTNLFRAAASYAYKMGYFSEEQKHKYYRSVTESEVSAGLLEPDDRDCAALCFQRELNNINLEDKKAGRYEDLEGGVADTEAQSLLEDLRDSKVPKVLTRANITKYSVEWQPEGIDKKNVEHAQYLKTLVKDFVEKMTSLISATDVRKDQEKPDKLLFNEVLHHLQFCNGKKKNFHGCENLIANVHSKVLKVYNVSEVETQGRDIVNNLQAKGVSFNEEEIKQGKKEIEAREEEHKQIAESISENTQMNFAMEEVEMSTEEMHQMELFVPQVEKYKKPLIIHGPSGSGKTAIMATVAAHGLDWFGHNTVRIIRFLGTSPSSTSIRNTLENICQQIHVVYGITPSPDLDLKKNFSYLKLYFKALLWKIDTVKKPLLIIFDSVDQLTKDDYAHSFTWMPAKLPPNVVLVVSMIPEENDCLENCHNILLDEERYVEVPAMPNDVAIDIMEDWLKDAGRTVTEAQKLHVLSHFIRSPQPLYLKLLFEQAQQWPSYLPKANWRLGATVKQGINMIFSNLEKDHGETLVRRGLGYLTAARRGLSDAEMEDLLSLDDEVLQDTYLHHLPPSDKTIRLPPLIWKRVRYALQDYLVERLVDGKNVTTWYHRQFYQTAYERYVCDSVKKGLHNGLVEYFMGKWSNIPKPLELYKQKKGSYPNANRGVPEQPLIYQQGVFNLRKMTELPYHLIQGQQFHKFASLICLDLEWLYVKTKAVNIHEVLTDMQSALEAMDDLGAVAGTQDACDIQMVYDMLVLASDAISTDACNLQLQIIGQVEKDTKEPVKAELRRQAIKWTDNMPIPLLVPKDLCLPQAGGDLKATLDIVIAYPDDAMEVENKLSLSDDTMALFVAERNKGGTTMKILDLSNNGITRHSHQLPVDIKSIHVMAGNRFILMEVYIKRDKYNPKVKSILFDQRSGIPMSLPDDCKHIFCSSSGHLICIPRVLKTPWASVDELQIKPDEPYEAPDELEVPAEVTVPSTKRTGKIIEATAMFVYEYGSRAETVLADRPRDNPDLNFLEFADALNPFYKHMLSVIKSGKYQPALNVSNTKKKGQDEKSAAKEGDAKDYVATIFEPETQKVWSQLAHPSTREGRMEIGEIEHAIFSPDEQFIAITMSDKCRYIWNVETGRFLHKFGKPDALSLGGHYRNHSKTTLTLPNNTLLCPGLMHSDNLMYLRDMRSGETVHEMDVPDYTVGLVTLSDDSQLAACGTQDSVVINGNTRKYIRVFDLNTGEVASEIPSKGPYSTITICGSKNEYVLTSSIWESILKMWYVGTDQDKRPRAILIYELVGHNGPITNAGIANQGQILYTASTDNTIRLWDTMRILEKCNKFVKHLQTDMATMIKARADKHSAPYKHGEGEIVATNVVVSKQGAMAVVGTRDGWVIFYDLMTMEIMFYARAYDKSVNAMVGCGRDELVVTAGTTLDIWKVETGEKLHSLQLEGIECLAEANGVLVAGKGGMEGYGYIIDMLNGECVQKLSGLHGFHMVAITSDAKKVATAFFDCPVLYDLESGQPLQSTKDMETRMYKATCLRISPDDKYLVTGSTDGSVKVADVETGMFKFRMQHKSKVVEAIFSPNSKLLLTSGFKNILVWCMHSGNLISILSRHQDFITKLVFVCEGKYLVSASNDKRIIVWDFMNRFSIADFHTDCAINNFKVASDLGSIVYMPHNIAYIAVLRPNPALKRVTNGEPLKLPSAVVQAQALAFAFSGQKLTDKSSRACNIL